MKPENKMTKNKAKGNRTTGIFLIQLQILFEEGKQ